MTMGAGAALTEELVVGDPVAASSSIMTSPVTKPDIPGKRESIHKEPGVQSIW